MRSFLILSMLTAPAAAAAQPLSVTASVAVLWLDRPDFDPGPPTFGEPVSLGEVSPPAVVALWRDRPGWAFDADFTHEAAAFGSWDGPRQGAAHLRSTGAAQGRIRLELAYAPATRTAFVNGLPVRLPAGHDVILVDHADGRPTVVGTLRVGGSEPEPIEEFLGRSPDLVEFVRCDLPLPEETSAERERARRSTQRILDERCQLMAGTHPGSGLRDVPLVPLEPLPQ